MILHAAWRSLRHTPVYALAVIATLALGLASVGAMFAVVHGVLLAPLPYGAPERLVSIQLEMPDGSRLGLSPAVLATFQRFATPLEDVALHRTGSANVWTQADGGAEHMTASWITASTMQVLQARPLLGRPFSEDEQRRGGPDAVILGEHEWRARFGAGHDVIGKTLIVNDVPREIVGVMPERFAFPGAGTRIWLPAKSSDGTVAGDFFYTGIGRLADGQTPGSAQRALDAALAKLAELYPRLQSGGSTADWIADSRPVVRVQPLRAAITEGIAPLLWTLAGVAGLVLLVAWANVANLVLIRADAARQSAAIREALGASPMRASAPLFGEAALLGAAAAIIASFAATAALKVLAAFGPIEVPRLTELTLGPWPAAVIVLVAVVGTVGGTAIMTRLDRAERLSGRLGDGARGQTPGRSRQRLRTTVTVMQIAAALVVLAGSALLLRTAHRLDDVNPGFDADGVSTFRILLPFARYPDGARVAFHARLTEKVGELPSVLAAGLVSHLPLDARRAPEQMFRVDGGQARPMTVNVAGDGYFDAMRIPVLAGRDFRALEGQRPGELIISQRAALMLFADPTGTDSIGRTLSLDPGGPTYTVIGVAGDVRHAELSRPPEAMVYRPQVVASAPAVEPGPLPAMVLVVRSSAPPDALAAAVRRIVHALDPGVPVFEASEMRDVVRGSMGRLTLMLAVISAAAAVTVAMGTIGLYGVMAYAVALRTREFGLRMALGAAPDRIARWILARGLMLTAFGISAGGIVFAIVVPYLRASIHGIAPCDPLPVVGAVALLLCTSALACWIPARRASAVDPAQALRAG